VAVYVLTVPSALVVEIEVTVEPGPDTVVVRHSVIGYTIVTVELP